MSRNSRPEEPEPADIRRLTGFFQSSPNPVFVVDVSGGIAFASDGAKRALASLGPDASAEMFIPKDISDILASLRRREQTAFEREVAVGDRVFKEDIHVTSKHDAVLVYARDITELRSTEQELRRQTALLRGLIESPTDIIVFAVDRNYCYTAFNTAHREAMKKAYGVDVHPGASVLDIIDRPEVRTRMQQTIDRALAGESFTSVDVDPGRGIWYEFNWNPIRGPEGNVEGVTAFVRDITRRKRVETALTESELKYRRLFESSNDAIMMLDTERFVDCNEATLKVFGYSTRDEFLGKHPAEVSPPRQADGRDSRVAADEKIATAFRTGRNYFEWLHQRADGTVFPADVLLTPMDFRGQRVLQATVRDISARKQAEAALRDSEERYRQLVEETGEGIGIADADERFVYTNRAADEVFGVTRGGLVGRSLLEFLDKEQVQMVLRQTAERRAGRTNSYELLITRPDGTKRVTLVTASPRHDVDGGYAGSFGIVRDITELKRAEEQLRQTSSYLENLIGCANAPIIVWDPEFKITRFNRAFEHLTGHAVKEVLGRDIGLLFPAERREESLGMIRRTATGERWETVEIPILRKDGAVRTVLWNSATLFGPDGKTPVATIAQGQDITELRQAMRQAEAERDRLRRILDAMPDGVYLVGQDWLLQYVNPALLDRCGPVDGRKCYEYFHGRTEPCPDCANPQVFAGGSTRREYTTVRGDTYDIQDVPVTGDDGRPARLVFLRDITARKQAELRGRQHLEDTALLRDTALGFITLGPQADIYRYIAQRLAKFAGDACNVVNSYDPMRGEFCVRAIEGIGENAEAVLKLLGRPPVGKTFKLTPEQLREYSGNKLMEIEGGLPTLSHGSLPKVVADAVESVFGPGDVHAMSFYWQEKILGTVYIIMHRDVSLRDPAMVEAFVNQAAIALQRKLDADELGQHREHLQELVRERTAELEAANREMEAFSYSASHDLRAPLRAIDGFAQALVEDCGSQLDERGRGHLERMRAAARKMAELIDDLLNLARIARLPLERKPVNLSEMARTIAADWRRAAPDREVKFVIPDGLTLPADPVLTEMVLRNLMSNAWKFTSRHPTARIELGTTRGSGERVFFVRDDGAGFDMAYADKLFVPFQRLHSDHEFPGSGIGLAIVQRIVRRHGGRVWFEAEVDGGATCWFTLGPTPKETERGRKTRQDDTAG